MIASRTLAQGPHQYLATNPARDRVYATTWAQPPTLSSWAVDLSDQSLSLVNTVPISASTSVDNAEETAATSSYVHWYDGAIYSAGGPTGEVHAVDARTGGFGEKLQEMLYVEPSELPSADKTRVALVRTPRATPLCPTLFAKATWRSNSS